MYLYFVRWNQKIFRPLETGIKNTRALDCQEKKKFAKASCMFFSNTIIVINLIEASEKNQTNLEDKLSGICVNYEKPSAQSS